MLISTNKTLFLVGDLPKKKNEEKIEIISWRLLLHKKRGKKIIIKKNNYKQVGRRTTEYQHSTHRGHTLFCGSYIDQL